MIKRFLLTPTLLLCLLFSSPAWAAFGFIGAAGAASSITSGTTLAITTSAAVENTNFGVVIIALDNTCTVDAETSEVSSISDGANTYVKLKEFCNTQAGVAADGATISTWYFKPASTLATSSTVTITFANTITAKVARLWEFSIGASKIPAIATGGGATLAATQAENPGSITLSSLASKEYLFLRSIANESNANCCTITTNYTALTASTANTGAVATSQRVWGEFRILTATGDTSNPTNVGNTDFASTYLALEEVAAGVTRRPIQAIFLN